MSEYSTGKPAEPVKERDLRIPEFRDVDPSELEKRSDGKVVRKDRWERAVRDMWVALGGSARQGFEVPEVVDKARQAMEALRACDATIREARDVFNHYAAVHRQKGTPEGEEKAKTNAAVAQQLEDRLTWLAPYLRDDE